ncbi:MAG: Ig-like domain-containing protein [Gemmatimonadales bacterium]|nr:MAG: Ig-like domain-containing protein [Gemmatimonadales bacterium]
MRSTSATRLAAAATVFTVLGGCSRDLDLLDPAPFPSESVVFDDGFASGVDFQAFLGSKADAVQIDPADTYQGSASLRVTVPTPSDPTGSYAGGAFTANTPRDLSGYNALTFYAKAATSATLNVVGIGNDNTGTSLYTAETGGLALSTSWQKFVVPLPLPEKLDQEGGLFFFAEGAEGGQANVIWFDEIKFEDLPGLGAPQPAVVTKTVSMAVGETTQAAGTVTFDVGARDVVVNAAPSYFTWTSSNPSVATVSEAGLITMVAEGTAEITATLGTTTSAGAVTVQTGAGLVGLVFGDDFGEAVDFQAFAGSKTDAVQLDDTEAYQGSRSLKIAIPVPTDPSGSYAGGAFTTTELRDLTTYNALTFWAKAATPATLNVAGIGNDNTGTSLYTAETGGFALTAEWRRFVVPIPLPEKLDQEAGLFFFAEGAENDQANTFWFDEIQFEDLAELGAPAPAVATKTVNLGVGEATQADGTVTFPAGGQDVVMSAAPSYFTWSSSNPAVATVSSTGLITMVAEGSAEITATLGAVAATGSVTVQTTTSAVPPSAPAPDPTQDAANVISIYSDSYTDVANAGFAQYGAAAFEEVDVAGSGNSALKYTFVGGGGGNFQVLELGGANQIDAAAAGMTNFRFDLYFPNELNASSEFLLKLVDIPAGGFTEAQIRVDASSSPAIAQGSWLSFDFTLTELAGLGLGGTGNIQQVVFDLLNSGEVYVDNLYLYK